MSDEECVRAPRRGKRPALHLESSSDSDSDCIVDVVNKRKKMNTIESESSSDSNASSEEDERISRPTKKRPRVSSDNESTSEESSDESSEESSEESSCEDSDDNVVPPTRGRSGRVARSRRVESDESSSESESEETSSESGRSSAGSFESYDNTDEEAMIQAAIQESLATVKESEAEKETAAKKKTVVPEASGFASDTSDGQSEKCPICLLSFTNQEIGSPETCDHTFCSVCIQEWAKNVNTCPVDRQVFSLILVRKQLNGKVIKKIPIANREARDLQESDSDPTFCEVCGRSDREDRLLLCDGCDLGYHLECLNPPMENVPIEEWFCPECATDQPSTLAEEIDVQDGELFDLLDDMVQVRPRTSRLLPRTRQSERVRATLRSLHQEFLHRTHEPALQQPSTSGIESVGADSSSVGSGARVTSAASASTVRRRKIVRRKTVKKRRKRRTTKRTTKRKPVRRKKKVAKKIVTKGSDDEECEEIEEYVPKTKRRKRRKRKIRRRKKISRRKSARTAVPRSVKGRLAEQLGLCAPTRPGMSLPVIRSRVTASDIDMQRSRAGIPTLHIYGPQNELDYFSSDNEDVMGGASLAIAARPRIGHVGTARLIARKKLSAAALQSHTAVISPKPIRNKVNTGENVAAATASSSPVDLIGSILDSQAIWHSKTSSVTIKPDGSLEVNKDHGGTAVANTQGTVECDSVSDKNKTNGSLIRSDNRLSEVNGSSTSPIDLGSASARTTQAPMYPGRGDNHNRPPPSSGFHQFGGNRYSAPSYSNYQGGRDFSNFSSSASNFDASSTRAGYSNYLNSGLPPAPLRNTPVRFRVTPRYPIRRPQGPQRPQDPSKPDDKRSEDDGEGCQKSLEEEEDDEIDIYSDIEAGGGGSGGPSGGGSELDEAERNMETSYEALPPPPEPSALLMGFGEQVLSEEEPTSDSELVIDDNVGPPSPHDQNESYPQIPESEKYDPAEPLADSDDDDDCDDNNDEPETIPVRNEAPDGDIPLPPAPPASVQFQSSTNISQHIINSSSNSNASYLHSPTYGESSFDTEKLSTVTDDGVVNKVVKEVISERLKNTSGIISVNVGHNSPPHTNVGSEEKEEEEDDECPNFSIYSATSMDIARRTVEETIDMDSKVEDEKICQTSANETKEEEREIEEIDVDRKSDKADNESEDKLKPPSEVDSPSASPDVKQLTEIQDIKDNSEELEDEDEKECTNQVEKKQKVDNSKEDHDHKVEEIAKADQVDPDDQSVKELKENDSNSSIEDLSSERVVSDTEEKDEEDNETEIDISKELKEPIEEDKRRQSPSPSKEFEDHAEKISCKLVTSDAFDSDNDSLIGDVPSAVSVVVRSNDSLAVPAPSGLEGLDTETISETEEAINFDDISQDGNEIASAEEDGEISSAKKRKKKKNHRNLDVDGKMSSDLSGEIPVDREQTPPEEGEIIDDRPKLHDNTKRDKSSIENKDTTHEMETSKVTDENFDISKTKDDDKKKKKKEKRKSSEKGEDRPVLGSSENRRKSKEKSRRSEEPNISWKKPSKNTKERNYRDTKTTKTDDAAKDKDKDDDGKDANKKKKKEKRKDMERYDVRKIVSDKRRRRKDEFGRDLSRDRTYSRSRSRSHRRSRSLSKNRRHRSPVRVRRSRSRSRYRSRSRSYRRSRSKSKNRSRRKSKDKGRRSRSKDRTRVRVSRSRSRGRRSRTRSASHSRTKNKTRLRSRSRTPVKQRKERADRSHVVREVQRFHTRRSWSRTWTPSWSRSRSRSISCSSFTQSRSPSVRHFNRSFSHSFSRSWSRERYERIPLEKTGALSGKPTKKLTVIVSNTKENSDRQKKDKKKKKEKKGKEMLGLMEKRKKRKEKSPAPSKEVFTSGDNILVSVNFNKSSKTGTNKDISASLPALSKETAKRKRDEIFETDREIGKKIRKEKNKEKNKGIPNEKNTVGMQAEKKGKKQGARGNKSARMAALLKQKPVAIIDLDQSPFREQTPSPRDLIVLSDSDDDVRNKGVEHEEMGEPLSVCRNLRTDITSPQSPAKGVHNVPANISVVRSPETELKLLSAVSNYLTTSTGPKTPPEPQIKFSIATKQPQLRVINNPLQEDDDMPEDGGLDDSDQRIEEELDRSLGDIVYKGPNTPPEPRGPTTPCSPPTSPDAYDPFDPTKSGTPSPAGPEASMDGPPSPLRTPADEMQMGNTEGSGGRDSPLASDLDDMVNKNAEARNKSPPMQTAEEVAEEARSSPKVVTREAKSPVGITEATALTPQLPHDDLPSVTEITDVSKVSHGLPSSISSVSISESNTKSPERKIGVVITAPQSKLQTPIKPPVFPIPSLKQVSTSQQTMTSTPSHAAPPPIFPSLTPVNIASMLCTPTANLALSRTNLFTPQTPMSVPSLLQHVSNATPVQARLSTDKPVAPPVPIRSLVQNGEQLTKPQDTTTEVVDMDLDSPYSPGSSEGDDLFDPPADTPTKSGQPTHSTDRSKTGQSVAKNANKLAVPASNLPSHKSPSKNQDKFDSIFGVASAPTKVPGSAPSKGRTKGHKGTKSKTKHVKGGKKEIAIKMDEDQLQILDELPSSAVELQVKDKFLKKLNRQERVVEEVKLSLKPHYNRKHITKEEYKDILRKSVPKICHNKSGEINPVKIATLVEAYVKKVRYEKKKGASSSSGTNSTPAKAKVAKTTKWS